MAKKKDRQERHGAQVREPPTAAGQEARSLPRPEDEAQGV